MLKRTPSRWLRIVLPLVIILTWFGVSAVGGPYFGRIEEVSEVDLTAFLPKSAEATKVSNSLSKFQDSSTLPAILVFKANNGPLTKEQRGSIDTLTNDVAKEKGIEGEISPAVISDDGSAAFLLANVYSDA